MPTVCAASITTVIKGNVAVRRRDVRHHVAQKTSLVVYGQWIPLEKSSIGQDEIYLNEEF